MKLNKATKKFILTAQKNEITEHFIYKKLASSIKHRKNKDILKHLAKDELRHYRLWKKITGKEVKPNKLTVFKYFLISKIFGITFGIKLMEGGERKAKKLYKKIAKHVPAANKIIKDEDKHEKKIIALLKEERLEYVGSIVLGLNDALVELTGALAGLTLAFQKTNIIAVAGLITGIAASLSMAASEYLSTKSEGSIRNPFKASIYTGFAYILTVLFLIFPYFLLANPFSALAFTVVNAIIIILLFTYYNSVTKEISFKKRFLEMALLSLGVALISFFIGFLIRTYLNIEI